jgi:exodeoxyribonuclease-5
MINLSIEQSDALAAINEAIKTHSANSFVLSGSAGTGKSTVIAEWLKTFSKKKLEKVVVTAPTNKAVKVIERMTLTAGVAVDCCTIHSLLGLRVTQQKNKEVIKPIGRNRAKNYDVIIIDEASMISFELMEIINRSIAPLCTFVVFMGDPCQLPPIGEVESVVFRLKNRVHLTKLFRQGEGSRIINLCGQFRDAIESKSLIIPDVCSDVDRENNHGVRVVDGVTLKKWVIDAFTSESFNNDSDSYRYIAWRNAEVITVNRVIQLARYPGLATPFAEGETVVFNSPVHALSGVYDMRMDNVEHGWEEIIISNSTEATIVKIEKMTPMEIAGQRIARWFLMVDSGGIKSSCTVADDFSQVEMVLGAMALEANRTGKWFDFWYLQKYFARVRPVYASTAHLSQGSTFKGVFVNSRDIFRNTNRVEALQCGYVAISRAKENVIYF